MRVIRPPEHPSTGVCPKCDGGTRGVSTETEMLGRALYALPGDTTVTYYPCGCKVLIKRGRQ